MPQPDTMPTAVVFLATWVAAVFLVAWQTRQLAQMQRDVITTHARLENIHEKIDSMHEEVNKKLDGMQDQLNKKLNGTPEAVIYTKLDRIREEFTESQITNLPSDDAAQSTIGDMETQAEDHVESLDNCRDPDYDQLIRSLDQDKEQEEQPSDID